MGVASALAWPVSVCTAAVVALVIFKKEIGSLIARIKTIGRQGVTTDTALTSQEVQASATSAASAADELLKDFDNQLLVEQENMILKYLQDKHVQASGERERVLVRHLSAAYTMIRFENVYHSIFGSQLRVLEALNQSEPQGLPQQAFEAWYEFGKSAYPQYYAAYSFQEWFGYLEASLLVIRGANGLLRITVFAREFLKYLIQCGYGMTKNG